MVVIAPRRSGRKAACAPVDVCVTSNPITSAVEVDGPVEVGHLEVDMPDAGAGGGGVVVCVPWLGLLCRRQECQPGACHVFIRHRKPILCRGPAPERGVGRDRRRPTLLPCPATGRGGGAWTGRMSSSSVRAFRGSSPAWQRGGTRAPGADPRPGGAAVHRGAGVVEPRWASS